MFAPGYYKNHYRALRFRELARMHGWRRVFWVYLTTRFKQPGGGHWTPGLWADTECKREELSEQFWVAMKPHRSKFERLGYTECSFANGIKNSLNPMAFDSGSIRFLDPSCRYFGILLYAKVRVRSTGAELSQVTIAFTAAFEHGSFSCSNGKMAFDPPSEREVIRIDSSDVTFIHQQFLNYLAKRKETPREFPDQESLRQWFDARQIAAFDEHARRRLFLPMTEQEVAAAKASVAQAVAGVFPPVKMRYRLEFWPVIIVLIVGLQFLLYHQSRTSDDTIEYRGESFKMSKPYSTYEDYKDDPDNLDTNELDRIEQAITTAKIRSSFKDRKGAIHARFDLKFPGYGAGGLGEGARTDDGSAIEVESVEIPQRNKERWFVVREYRGEWNLVDDFGCGTATNTIQRTKLENQVLRYYDDKGNVLREKHL